LKKVPWQEYFPKMQGGTTTAPEVIPGQETDLSEAFAKGWRVIVWNDPVNLMSYVVFVFMRVLGFNETKAQKHMLEVHEQGRSVVAMETREKAEFYCHRLQEFGLKSTLEATAG
jgi:ATP-dependent Clp protease adaptor protein ClpS